MADLENTTWEPYREPARATLSRTGTIAVVGGAVFAGRSGRLPDWPLATLLMLWPALGGHFIELWFLNWLRPRVPAARATQTAARIAVWFVGGIALAVGMRVTETALRGNQPSRWPAWWVAGLAFVAIELVVHLVLRVRGKPSFHDGRG